MRKRKIILKFLTICMLSGAIISNVPLFSLPIASASVKSHDTVTRNGIMVYNDKNLHNGDHYIPAGTPVHYKDTRNGVQIWSNKKLSAYNHNYAKSLRHGKHYKYLITYASLHNSPFMPKNKKEQKRYKVHQDKVNKYMKHMSHTKGAKAPIEYGPATASHSNKNKTKKLRNRHNHRYNKRIHHKRITSKRNKRHKKHLAKLSTLRSRHKNAQSKKPFTTQNSHKGRMSKPQGNILPKTSEQPSFINDIINML